MDDETKLLFVTTFSSLITAAFGLVAALAWNETIKEAVARVFKDDGALWGNLIYAILVTILAVIITVWVARSVKKLSDKIKEDDKKD